MSTRPLAPTGSAAESAPRAPEACERREEWTPEQQLANVLEICGAQMQSALSESDLAVETLLQAFTAFAAMVRELESLPEELKNALPAGFSEQLASVGKQVTSAVVAFQFYDKLTQRLGHVRYSLSALATFVCNKAQASEREHWQNLLATLERLYRTQEERQLFQRMAQGLPASLASEPIDETTPASAPEQAGEIELF
ncbi:MAG TPA: hypothetical protein VF193_00265 [Steroidobacter sp.]